MEKTINKISLNRLRLLRAIFGWENENFDDDLEKVLGTLSERERKILQLRFGLIDGRMRTLTEVAKEYRVTRERIRQIEAKALRKLRHPFRRRMLLGENVEKAAYNLREKLLIEIKELREKLLIEIKALEEISRNKNQQGEFLIGKDIEELDLPTQIINLLLKNGIKNLYQLEHLPLDELRKTKGIGEKSIIYIRDAIEKEKNDKKD